MECRDRSLRRIDSRMAHSTGVGAPKWSNRLASLDRRWDRNPNSGPVPKPARPEALPRILGELNYSLTTSTNGRRELKVFATHARSSTREIVADEGEGVIPNELIIRSKSGSPSI